jgi:acetate kinase
MAYKILFSNYAQVVLKIFVLSINEGNGSFMKILVINCGSSSLKYQLLDMRDESVLAKGLCDRIGLSDSIMKHSSTNQQPIILNKDFPNHTIAIQEVLSTLTHKTMGVLSSLDEITGVGHRVVHGGEAFKNSSIITDDILSVLEECSSLAPLHNPPNLSGIVACKDLMPETPMIAVFDTSFHQTMPSYAYLYSIPYEFYENYKLRKYGFHGTSHKYVSQIACAILGKPLSALKIITCHLGNGSSICAIKNGESLDTSMGFTPLEGLPMGTRSGSIDPALIEFIMKNEDFTISEVMNVLNKKSGVLGISGLSSDFRDLEDASNAGNIKATLALDIFNYKVRKYIGEYAAAMEGLDAVVFTGGIGENNPTLREDVSKKLSFMGFSIDPEKNQLRGQALDISTEEAKVRILVIPTNEELTIARDAKFLIEQ